jgi:hypothetical protein
MRDNFSVVARPKGVIEAFMDKDFVCRTSLKVNAVRSLVSLQMANL